MPEVTTWGATVDEVSAVAPHIGLITSSTEPAGPVDDVFGESTTGKITRAQVQSWIEDIAARIELRLSKLSRIVVDSPARSVLTRACHDLTVTGAASYLVAAAFPSNAGINGDSSYAGLLWARFESGLDDLAAQLDAIIDDGDTAVVLPKVVRSGMAVGNFPAPLFTDGQRW